MIRLADCTLSTIVTVVRVGIEKLSGTLGSHRWVSGLTPLIYWTPVYNSTRVDGR